MTLTRLHVSVLLGIATALWFAVLYWQGIRLTWEELRLHLAPFGTVVGALTALAVGLERYAWRIPALHGWFVKRPDLRGTWRVTLQSDWKDPETGEGTAPIVCYMGVEQTLSTLQMHLMTPESESWFIADQIRPSTNATGYQVVGVYTNKPQMHLRGDRSEIHQGALIFETHGHVQCPDTMTGEYWTDRGTSGTMTLADRRFEIFMRFSDADRAHAGPGS